MSVFGKYADFYDFLYKDKDYQGECDTIEEIFKKYSKKKVSSILDLGCGTGNHAFVLVDRGYKIVGVDRSEAMLSNAERKLAKFKKKKNLSFQIGDIRNWRIDEKFDAVIMMFAVLGYQLNDDDVFNTLATVKRHLQKDGLFIFDVWYGPAVLVQKPSNRIRTVETHDGQIIRKANSDIDTQQHICTVHYKTSLIKGNRLIKETKEDHQMRYFFPGELKEFLKSSGFKQLTLGSFPDWKKKPDSTTWNIFAIANSV